MLKGICTRIACAILLVSGNAAASDCSIIADQIVDNDGQTLSLNLYNPSPNDVVINQIDFQSNIIGQPIELMLSSGTTQTYEMLPLTSTISIPANSSVLTRLIFTETTVLPYVSQFDYTIGFSYGAGCSLHTTESHGEYGEARTKNYHSASHNVQSIHDQGIKGAGTVVAIIDSGLATSEFLENDSSGAPRVIAKYNAFDGSDNVNDEYGHGTHVASVLASSKPVGAEFEGIAPDAKLVVVKAFDENGVSSYATIVNAINYLIENQSTLNVDIVNLSFGVEPSSNYWDDPINIAVIKAYEAGMTIVTSSGNSGVGKNFVPGNNPFAITVGAIDDAYTSDTKDDKWAAFSSYDVTSEGYLKPDFAAVGTSILGQVPQQSTIATGYPFLSEHNGNMMLSGTSQSAAIVSGVAALAKAQNPTLDNASLRCLLANGANYAPGNGHRLGYGAVTTEFSVSATGCAFMALDAHTALNSESQFVGNIFVNENGQAESAAYGEVESLDKMSFIAAMEARLGSVDELSQEFSWNSYVLLNHNRWKDIPPKKVTTNSVFAYALIREIVASMEQDYPQLLGATGDTETQDKMERLLSDIEAQPDKYTDTVQIQ